MLAGTPLVPFHGDEATQIFMSRDYAYQFLQRDLSFITYSEHPTSPTEQHLRLINGTINKYLIGLAWHVGGFQLADINQQWDWGADWDYNQHNDHAPTPQLLLTARWPSALFLAAGVVVIFGLGRLLGGQLTGYLVSLYYALNPVLLLNGRRAMMEGSAIFFGLLVVLAGVWFLQHRSWWTAALLGLSGGLALASKHTTVFAVAGVFGVCIVATLVSPCQPVKHPTTKADSTNTKPFLNIQRLSAASYPVVAILLMLLVFYLLNPAWWNNNPIVIGGEVLRLRQELLDVQAEVFGGYSGLSDRVAGFLRQTLIALPQYYEAPGWDAYIGDQIDRYEASVWRGVSIGGSLPGAVALLGIISVGMWALIRDRTISASIRWLMGIWVLMVTLPVLVLTPLEWQRYYLPVYPAIGLALGMSYLFRRLKR